MSHDSNFMHVWKRKKHVYAFNPLMSAARFDGLPLKVKSLFKVADFVLCSASHSYCKMRNFRRRLIFINFVNCANL